MDFIIAIFIIFILINLHGFSKAGGTSTESGSSIFNSVVGILLLVIYLIGNNQGFLDKAKEAEKDKNK